MNLYVSVFIRALFTFVAFLAIQYVIPWYFLAPAGFLAGLFLWKTGDDRALGYGLLIGSVAFAVFACLYGTV